MFKYPLGSIIYFIKFTIAKIVELQDNVYFFEQLSLDAIFSYFLPHVIIIYGHDL